MKTENLTLESENLARKIEETRQYLDLADINDTVEYLIDFKIKRDRRKRLKIDLDARKARMHELDRLAGI